LIQFIYFDLGKVLLDFDHQKAARQLGALCGWEPARVYEFVFRTDLNRRCDGGMVDAAEFCRLFRAETGCTSEDAALVLASSDIFRINPSTNAILAHLKAAGYRLGMLSNTCDMHYQFFSDGRFAMIADAFDVVVLSYALKVQKPDAAIYAEATRLAGVEPQEIFFTDDMPANVEGAKQFGWDAVLFTGAADLARELRARGIRFNY
jgi:putative hydrolase of the HAD superfamily